MESDFDHDLPIGIGSGEWNERYLRVFKKSELRRLHQAHRFDGIEGRRQPFPSRAQ
jgi:hypothetical protein